MTPLPAFQSVQTGPEAPGPACEAALPPCLAGELESVWEQAAGVPEGPEASAPPSPGHERQPDRRRHHAGGSEWRGGAQDGEQPLCHGGGNSLDE